MHDLVDGDEFVEFVLCFPRRGCNGRVLRRRIQVLHELGIESLYEEGRIIHGFRVLGRGYSSIVFLARHKDLGKVVVKARRLDSRRSTLEYEAMIMDYLQPTMIPPVLHSFTRDFIIMEYVNCPPLIECLFKYDDITAETILEKVFASLYLLDLFGIDHGELNRPHEHMYLCPPYILRIIDWESSRIRGKIHNLTMFASYLFYRSGFYTLDDGSKAMLGRILRLYKNNTAEGFTGILGFLRSHEIRTGRVGV